MTNKQAARMVRAACAEGEEWVETSLRLKGAGVAGAFGAGLVLGWGGVFRDNGHAFENLINQAVLDHFAVIEPFITIAVAGDALDGLAGLEGINLVEAVAYAEHLAGFDLDIGGLPFHHAAQQGLVHEVAGIFEGKAFALGSGAGNDAAHAGGLTHDVRGNIALKEAHGVEDGQPRGNATAGAINIKMDIVLGVVVSEEEKLGNDEVGHVIAYSTTKKDDAVLEQARVDVVRALALGGLLDHDWYEVT